MLVKKETNSTKSPVVPSEHHPAGHADDRDRKRDAGKQQEDHVPAPELRRHTGQTNIRHPAHAAHSRRALCGPDCGMMAPPEGFEPPTPALGRRRSIH